MFFFKPFYALFQWSQRKRNQEPVKPGGGKYRRNDIPD